MILVTQVAIQVAYTNKRRDQDYPIVHLAMAQLHKLNDSPIGFVHGLLCLRFNGLNMQ